MPQISLYIDEDTLEKLKKAALEDKVSISKWVAKQIKTKLRSDYPGNFENLFGSISDESFNRPGQTLFSSDASREDF